MSEINKQSFEPSAGAASEAKLGVLHGVVADVLTTELQGEEVTAAMLGAAITFLKNNNITASATENAALNELNKTLAARRKRKSIDTATIVEAADHFAALNGQSGMFQ